MDNQTRLVKYDYTFKEHASFGLKPCDAVHFPVNGLLHCIMQRHLSLFHMHLHVHIPNASQLIVVTYRLSRLSTYQLVELSSF